MNLLRTVAVTALVWAASARSGACQEWTRFRGPNGSGVSTANTIPSTWTEKDFRWRLPMPGSGHSTPVIWGERVFVTAGDDASNRLSVLAVSASQGTILWRHDFPLERYHRNAYNTQASSSPTVDSHRVYVVWNDARRLVLRAFAHDGAEAWERDLGPFASQHGGGTSPIVYGETVFLAKEHDGESFLVALAAATGEVRWKIPRKTAETAYATPCVFHPEGAAPLLLFASHAHGLSAVDPAGGQVVWELSDAFDKRVVSSPVVAGDLIITACGSGEGGNYLLAVRPGDPVSGRQPEIAYTVRRASPYVPTSLCLGNLLFLWGDDGTVTCLETATGEMKWQEKLGKHFFGSPVCVDGRLFCASTTGDVVVVRAADRFEKLGVNSLGEPTHSTPAIANGRLYLHTTKSLICIEDGTRRNAE